MDETVLWQFLAVFLAASLAFVFEDIRERRRTARWVKRHLWHLANLAAVEGANSDLASDAADRQIAAIGTWLGAKNASDLSEDEWEYVNSYWSNNSIELGPILRSEALTALDEDLAQTLANFEHSMRYVDSTTKSLNRRQDAIQQAWAGREAPLSAANTRSVKQLQDAVEQLRHHLPTAYAHLNAVATKVDPPRNRSRLSGV